MGKNPDSGYRINAVAVGGTQIPVWGRPSESVVRQLGTGWQVRKTTLSR